jgi:hypothetical protein
MRDTIPIRMSRERHAQMQEYADANQITLTLALDLACKKLLSSGIDLRIMLSVADDAYSKAIDKFMAEPLK